MLYCNEKPFAQSICGVNIVIYSHKYVNSLQIIIKDMENKKVRCVFQNDEMISLCPDSRSSHLTTGISHGR